MGGNPGKETAGGNLFKGRLLLALSDGDMAASAYVDGILRPGMREESAKDTLTVIKLPIAFKGAPDRRIAVTEISMPNSVIGSPFALAAAPDGKTAFVLESFGPPPPGVSTGENVYVTLNPSSRLRSVDLTDPMHPVELDAIDLGRSYHTADVHPTGALLAVCSDEQGGQIALLPVREGKFGKPIHFPLRGIPESETLTGNIKWHPSGRFLAVTLTVLNKVAFYALEKGAPGKEWNLKPWGKPVRVGKFPYSGVWTPDGRFFITTDDQWGEDVPGFYFDPPPGQLSVVKFDGEGPAEKAIHEVVSSARTDISPEGIAVSPNGRLVATANLVRSFMPWDNPLLTPYSSLSLLRLDPKSGSITHLSDYRVDGILPESLVFDRAGEVLAVAIYERFDPTDHRGAIEFWEVKEGNPAALLPSGYAISVSSGSHTLLLIP